MKLKRNFTILIWVSGFITDLKDKSIRIKDIPSYLCSLFRVVFCRMKYFTINTKWCKEWHLVEGDSNYANMFHLELPKENSLTEPFLKYSGLGA